MIDYKRNSERTAYLQDVLAYLPSRLLSAIAILWKVGSNEDRYRTRGSFSR